MRGTAVVKVTYPEEFLPMKTPISARVPTEDCAAVYGVRQLAGIFATAMLSPGEADVTAVELTYEDGEHDTVFLVSGVDPESGPFTSLAGLIFGNEDSTSPQSHEWARSLRPLIQDALNVFDAPEDDGEAEPQVIDLDEFEDAAEALGRVDRGK